MTKLSLNIFSLLLFTFVVVFSIWFLSKSAPEIPATPYKTMDENTAVKLSKLPLSCILQKYPNKPGNVQESEADAVPHSLKTPLFSGCFDWHSSVHMHWTLVRLLRLFPDIETKNEIKTLLDAQFTEEKVATEIAFYNEKLNMTFERTYGWAWLMRLQAELLISNDVKSQERAETLAPLVKIIRDRTIEFFNKLPKPIRQGTHASTAFSMDHMLTYAKIAKDTELEKVIKQRAEDFFLKDERCPVDYEPSGVDFISPCLAEAQLMSQVLKKERFAKWLNHFLPDVSSPLFSNITNPPEITDHTDYVIGHLVGLNFQRAWSFKMIAASLDDSDPRKKPYLNLAAIHLNAGLNGMDKTGYGGEHWLASFATYALTE
ncbi:MAG TPA: DUF2891 domain-containing protein [bacterium]|nr:DUF2891 domain-containing protein [bacterium]HPS30746.1 DUF2891 domain-containing protein [bacterium]